MVDYDAQSPSRRGFTLNCSNSNPCEHGHVERDYAVSRSDHATSLCGSSRTSPIKSRSDKPNSVFDSQRKSPQRLRTP